jgi:hypothetical protein
MTTIDRPQINNEEIVVDDVVDSKSLREVYHLSEQMKKRQDERVDVVEEKIIEKERLISWELHGFNNSTLYPILCKWWDHIQFNSMDLLGDLRCKLENEPQLLYKEDFESYFVRRKNVVDKIVIRLNEELDLRNQWHQFLTMANKEDDSAIV